MSEAKTVPTSNQVDFHCHKCGAETSIAPNPPAQAVCENCCEDHDYRYEASERAHLCRHCGQPAPADWYDFDPYEAAGESRFSLPGGGNSL